MRHLWFAVLSAVLCSTWLTACAHRDAHRAAPRSAAFPAPSADFLIVAGDSTFWVTAGSTGVHVRGAPLTLARYGGRFYELYVADDDRSYYDAIFTGQRVFRRDIETNDSAIVFEDTAIAHAARAYARSHPSEMPLSPDDAAADDPSLSVTSDLDLLDVHGPYLSLEYHGERDGWAARRPDGESVEVVRRLVVDTRTGRPVTLHAIFGRRGGDSVLQLGRRAYVAAIDSVRARGATADTRAREAAQALQQFPFDSMSFTLTDVAHHPEVMFVVPGRGDQSGRTLGLPPVLASEPAWWNDERRVRPLPGSDSTTDEWVPSPSLMVLARYDTTGGVQVWLTDRAHHRWMIRTVPSPVRRLYWLDDPPLDTAARRALVRAFNESALYADDARAL